MGIKKKRHFMFMFLVVLVGAEVILRFETCQELVSDILVTSTDRHDLCHRLRKNVHGVINSDEYSVTVETNSLGFRDREYTRKKDRGVYRILVLGDSHTFGWGVRQEETFASLLEHDLNAKMPQRRFEVINCGVYGYGTGHELMFLTKYRLALEPDLVILAMDFVHDVWTNNRGDYYWEGDTLLRKAQGCFARRSRLVTRFVPFESFLRGHSYLFRFLGISLRRVLMRVKEDSPQKSATERASGAWCLERTAAFVHALDETLNQRGIKFALVVLPEFDSGGEYVSYPSFRESLLVPFEAFLRRGGLTHLSLQDAFDRVKDKAQLTYRHSHHFNTEGHTFIFEHIEEFLLNTWDLLN